MTKYTYDKRDLPFGHSTAVNDAEVINSLDVDLTHLTDINANRNFCSTYLNWIKSHTGHTILGLEDYKFAVYSHGTSEAFDKFYLKNLNRRFRIFKSEYLYHQLAWRNSKLLWDYIENDVLKSTDAVIISLPFADTGNKHIAMDDVLNECNRLNIPVLIDCAYFTISTGLTFDFTHPCITDITFSLSKTFPVAHARIGMRLTRTDDDDTLFVYEKANYQNRLGASLGLLLINKFSPEYIVTKYKDKQKEFCKLANVESSSTVIFGIATNNWKEYNRGGLTNRLSFHNYLDKDITIFKGVLDGSSVKQ